MKKTGFVFFGIILYIAIVTATALYIKAVSNVEPTATYVYAKTDIAKNSVITSDMLVTEKKSISFGHRYSINNINAVVGKVAKGDIYKDEMVLTTRLIEKNETNEISLKNKDNRKFTIKFETDQAVGWCLEVDQYVDIIFVPNPSLNQSNVQQVPSSPVGAQTDGVPGYDAKKITRIGNIRIAGIIDENGQLIKEKGNRIPKFICFEVTKEQDTFLAWAKSNGRLELSAIQQSN